MEAIVWNCGGL